ncbi:MAG: class I SAM-dependent methyltransferase [Chloroflexi bacterium]|nr:class I SAM-dependent methyltransferase [Chloroflexota bacterium]
MPDPISEVQAKYNDQSAVARFANRRFFQTIQSITGDLSAASILDVGCGEGVPLQMTGIERGSRIVGLDLDAPSVLTAQARLPQAHFLRANAEVLPFASASFDLVLCLETLEHVNHPARAITELARVSRRYALISTPNEPWWRIGNMARGKYWADWGNTPGHINHWSSGALRRLVDTQFEIIELRRVVLWTFILAERRQSSG